MADRKRGKEGRLFRMGELPLVKQLAQKYKPPIRTQPEPIDAVVKIKDAPDDVERAFLARQLVLCTTTHSSDQKYQGSQSRKQLRSFEAWDILRKWLGRSVLLTVAARLIV